MDLYVVNTNHPFDVDVTLDGDLLSIAIKPPAVDGVTPEPRTRSISLSSLRNRPDFGDHALFGIYDSASAGGDRVGPEVENAVSNLYAMTLASKVEASTYHRLVTQIFPVAAIYVPLASSPVSDWSLAVRVREGSTVTSSPNIEQKPGVSIPGIGESIVFPVVRFDSPVASASPEGSIEVPFYLASASGERLASGDAEVYLDSTGGTLVQRRVRTVGGRGTAIFRPDGLPVGATAKIKCGFKFFSGTDDCVVTIG